MKLGDKIIASVNGGFARCVLVAPGIFVNTWFVRLAPGRRRGNKSARQRTWRVKLEEVDEGITWCRGWSGAAVDALRAAIALAPTQEPAAPFAGILKFLQRSYATYQALPGASRRALALGALVVAETITTLLIQADSQPTSRT